jgi:hypothetical protein
MGWSALPYASGFFFAAWQSSQHGSSFLPSRSPSTASATSGESSGGAPQIEQMYSNSVRSRRASLPRPRRARRALGTRSGGLREVLSGTLGYRVVHFWPIRIKA